MPDDLFASENLSAEWINWGNYEFAPATISKIEYPDTFAGYAFTGVMIDNKFVIAPVEFKVGEIDPRDNNNLLKKNGVTHCTVTKIVVGIAPTINENIAYLQLESENPRWTYRSWPIACSTPEMVREELLGTHEKVDILIVDSLESVDYETQNHIFFTTSNKSNS